MNAIDQFRAAMRQAGLDYNGPIVADGRLHRFTANDDRAPNSLFADPPLAGAFGCWRRSLKETRCEKRGGKERWCDERTGEFTDAEWKQIRESWQRADAERERAEAERHAAARAQAQKILDAATPVEAHHPYLERKGIKAFGEVRSYKGALVLPLRDTSGALHSLQFVGGDGVKKFLTGGRVQAAFASAPRSLGRPAKRHGFRLS